LLQVTGGQTDEQFARLTIQESADLGEWMNKHGCQFQPPLRGTLHLARTNAHFLGGGKALMNAYYATAAKLGVEIIYEAHVRDLEVGSGKFDSAIFEFQGASQKVQAKSVVVASGGFQANLAWLKDCWGETADNFIIRGSPYDQGQPFACTA
jgi:tricarballylate dehydrogenase